MSEPPPSPPSLPCGLLNVGNTCSVNALTQCVVHCPKLRETLIASGTAKLRNGRSCVYADALLQLIRDLEAPVTAVKPMGYIRAVFDAIGDGFQPGEQHDLTELWMYLCDALTEEYGNRAPEAIRARYELPGALLKGIAAERDPVYARMVSEAHRAWGAFQKLSGISPFQEGTQGLMLSQVQCQSCKYICHNFEPFTVLSLELPEPEPAAADAPVPLHDCLMNFYKTETLASWTCDECRCARPAEKLVRIWTIPPTLVVSLKRFKYTEGMKKVRTGVTIPGEMHFHKGCILGHADHATENAVYQLCAFGSHHGGEMGGHYTAVGRCHESEWYFYDDDNVIRVNKKDTHLLFAKNPDVYLLFYERSQ